MCYQVTSISIGPVAYEPAKGGVVRNVLILRPKMPKYMPGFIDTLRSSQVAPVDEFIAVMLPSSSNLLFCRCLCSSRRRLCD